MSMNCLRCGSRLEQGLRFCENCGFAVGTVSPAANNFAQPVPIQISAAAPGLPPNRSREYAMPIQPLPIGKRNTMPWRWILGGVGIVGLLSLSALSLRPSGSQGNETSHEAGGPSQKPTVTPTSDEPPVSVTAPGTTSVEATGPASLSDQERDKFIRDGLGFSAANETDIVKQLGDPIKVNRHNGEYKPGQTAEFVELQYNGLSAEFLDGQLLKLTITDAKFPVAHDLGVGAAPDQIIQLLGKPNDEKNGEISYSDT
jgi:hypothetical protein